MFLSAADHQWFKIDVQSDLCHVPLFTSKPTSIEIFPAGCAQFLFSKSFVIDWCQRSHKQKAIWPVTSNTWICLCSMVMDDVARCQRCPCQRVLGSVVPMCKPFLFEAEYLNLAPTMCSCSGFGGATLNGTSSRFDIILSVLLLFKGIKNLYNIFSNNHFTMLW